MRRVLIILALTVAVAGCGDPNVPFVQDWHCPDDRLDRVEKMIISCRMEATNTTCTNLAKELLCDVTFVENPNYIEN